MKMAKATEKDIDAAGDAMTVLNDISSGYYPKRDGDDCEDFRFDPDDPAHLRKFYDLMRATLDASPGWPGRVIGGMCYVILYPKNEILDPDASTLELHPQWVKRSAAPCASAANSARPMSEWHEDWLLNPPPTDEDIAAAENEVTLEQAEKTTQWVKGVMKGLDIARNREAMRTDAAGVTAPGEGIGHGL